MRRFLPIGALVVVIIASGLGWRAYVNSFQEITFSGNAASIVLHRGDDSHDTEYSFDASKKPVLTITASGTYKIKKGLYVYVAGAGSSDYDNKTDRLVVGDKPVNTTITLGYSQAKLDQLKTSERPAVIAALQSAYPQQMSAFTPTSEHIYDQGEWYALKLTPRDGGDVYRAVLKKENGSWKVATKPPNITLAGPIYADVPHDILADINNF